MPCGAQASRAVQCWYGLPRSPHRGRIEFLPSVTPTKCRGTRVTLLPCLVCATSQRCIDRCTPVSCNKALKRALRCMHPYRDATMQRATGRLSDDPHPQVPFPDPTGFEQLLCRTVKRRTKRRIVVAFQNEPGLTVPAPQPLCDTQRALRNMIISGRNGTF